jgi:hypothetical protein
MPTAVYSMRWSAVNCRAKSISALSSINQQSIPSIHNLQIKQNIQVNHKSREWVKIVTHVETKTSLLCLSDWEVYSRLELESAGSRVILAQWAEGGGGVGGIDSPPTAARHPAVISSRRYAYTLVYTL